MSQHRFFESLENRQLLSAAPTLFNATIKADRLAIRADLLKFRLDIFADGVKLERDYHKVHKATAAGDISLEPSLQKLRSDAKALHAQLLADRLDEKGNAIADEAVIKLDILQIRKDKGNATAVAADKVKLTNDRITLQNDLLAGLDARIAARTAAEVTIDDDTQAIITAVNSDGSATNSLRAAVSAFVSDRATALNKLTNDLHTIVTARTKLANDLTAAQST